MRKKVFLLISAVCLVSALFTFNAYAGIEDAGDITLPEGDLDVGIAAGANTKGAMAEMLSL